MRFDGSIPLTVARTALLSLHLGCEIIDAILRRWMAREEGIDATLVATRLSCEHQEQLDHPASTPPGAHEDRHPCFVGLAFFGAVELQEDAAGQHTGRSLRSSRTPGIAE